MMKVIDFIKWTILVGLLCCGLGACRSQQVQQDQQAYAYQYVSKTNGEETKISMTEQNTIREDSSQIESRTQESTLTIILTPRDSSIYFNGLNDISISSDNFLITQIVSTRHDSFNREILNYISNNRIDSLDIQLSTQTDSTEKTINDSITKTKDRKNSNPRVSQISTNIFNILRLSIILIIILSIYTLTKKLTSEK